MQIYKRFNVTVVRTPRITSVSNSTVNFDLSSTLRIFFGGLNLSESETLKLVYGNEDCTNVGNSSLQPGTYVNSHATCLFSAQIKCTLFIKLD